MIGRTRTSHGRAEQERRRLRASPLLATLIVALLVPAAPASGATTLTFAPVADAHVLSATPTANFGTSTRLEVDNSPVKHTLIRFNVTGIGTAQVNSARLRLHALDPSNLGGRVFRAVHDVWEETAVTWNSAPAAATVAPAATLGPVAANTWYDVDVTSLVADDGPLTLRISSTSTDGADYVSRQGTAALRPQLVVVTSPSDTAPPTVSIAEPIDGATVSGAIEITVDADDDVGVTSVGLSVDGVSQGSDATAPYAFVVDTRVLDNGHHVLAATATDAAGNVDTSAAVNVTVDNVADLTPPSMPTGLTAAPAGPRRVDLSWTANPENDGVTRYAVVRDGSEVGTSTSTSFTDTTASPDTTHSYRLIAYDSANNPSDPSETVTVTTPKAPTGFTFAAAGDHDSGPLASASLAALDASDAEFYLALGDLDYDSVNPDSTWCDYVLANLPAKGPAYPFQLVAGNHEEDSHPDGDILNHAACLPDRLGSAVAPGSVYGANYTFDYPAGDPMMRVIMISPELTIDGISYSFGSGSPHRAWLTGLIDEAHVEGIPWVTVGLHYNCLTVAARPRCEMGASLWNLLLEKNVDLVLNAHEHTYQRTKQLALDPVACPAMTPHVYTAGCVVDDGEDGIYAKGAGTVNVIAGSFGRTVTPVDPTDPEASYFATMDDTTFGFMSYAVTRERIDATFVNTTGSFTDSFSIVRGAPPDVDPTPPVFDHDLPDRSDAEGAAVSLSAHATDPNGDTLIYAATGLPPGLSIGASTGSITGTIASSAAAGSPYAVSITVSDDGGATVGDTDTFSWTVTDTGGGGGSIAFRSASTGANNVGNNVVIPRPAGVQTGDVMVAVVDVKAAPVVPTPAGWTLVSSTANGSSFRQLVYWRVATGSEPASYTWSYGENRAASGAIVAYSGAATTNPVETYSAGTGTTTSITAPSLTSAVTGAMIVGAFGINADSTIAPPAGMTERGEIVSATRLRTEVSDVVLSAAGPTGAKIATAATAAANVGQLIALRPSGPPPANSPPTFDLDLPDRSDAEGAAVSLSAHATDLDGDTLAYAATGLPPGLSIDPATGLITGTISAGAAAGSPYATSITVSDDDFATVGATDLFSWTVTVGGGSIAFRDSSFAANAIAKNLTIPVPDEVQTGDVMLAVVDVKAVPTVGTPAGWTLVSNTVNGSSMRQLVYWRVAGSEPAGYTWSYGEGRAASGAILAYSGVSTTNPVQAFSAGTGATTAITAPSVTSAVAGAMIVGAFGINADSTIAPPAGMTERGEIVSATRLRTEVSDVVLSAAGPTGTKIATAATPAANVGQLIALRPSG